MNEILLRKAQREDIPGILAMIRELATYERAPEEVTITQEDLEKDGFGQHPVFEVILAEKNGSLLGMSFYYFSYSTWKGKALYLEDIVVREQFRGMGIGKILMDATIHRAAEINAKRMHWQVLEWNEPAINFYKKYNAQIDPEWVNCRLKEEQIKRFRS
ncbi:MAG: GNAT family N-acetyltransferase [Bacteroidota bacterium]